MPVSRHVEFGDFQTPSSLASAVCDLLATRGVSPKTILEPTCGEGNFLLAALDRFPSAHGVGAEVHPPYVAKLSVALAERGLGSRCEVRIADFFAVDWRSRLRELSDPVLVIGNPPWVTSAKLGALASANVPEKSNLHGFTGLDARTGKSNFDISEWMLIRLLEALAGRQVCMAVLVKTAVARKVLAYAWKSGFNVDNAEIRSINSAHYFGAAVDACLLLVQTSAVGSQTLCRVFASLNAEQPSHEMGWRDGQLIANLPTYDRLKHLVAVTPTPWRSGVKHDCSRVIELRKEASLYRNGLGERVELEDDYLYPMLKSSDLANGHSSQTEKWMLVPQRALGQNPELIRKTAPKTWAYLERHGESLDRRASSIYRNRPRFSVFGIGAYTFSPWKVAISGFYKRLRFSVVGSFDGKPIVLDDTVYFLACQSEEEANSYSTLLNSQMANDFFSAFVFWDAKRPITVDLLRRLDLYELARERKLGGSS